MPLRSRSSSSYSPSFDLGNPFLNHSLDAFLKIGAVGLAKAAVEEAWHMTRHGRVSKKSIQHSVKKMCKEGAFWGTAAGVYVAMEYGAGKIRGSSDWVNATIGGALAGALVSAVTSNSRDVIISKAITGGALATASIFLNNLAY